VTQDQFFHRCDALLWDWAASLPVFFQKINHRLTAVMNPRAATVS